MNKQLLTLSVALLVAFNYVALSKSEEVAKEDPKAAEPVSKPHSGGLASLFSSLSGGSGAGGLIPVVLVRQSNGKESPDFFLAWTNWQGLSQFSSMIKPITNQFQTFTVPMSNQLNNIPGLSQGFGTFDNIGNQVSGMNPLSMLQGGGGAGNPLSGLFQG